MRRVRSGWGTIGRNENAKSTRQKPLGVEMRSDHAWEADKLGGMGTERWHWHMEEVFLRDKVGDMGTERKHRHVEEAQLWNRIYC